jgi:hypothetical protein
MDFRRAWHALMPMAVAALVAVPPVSAVTPSRSGANPARVQRPARTQLLDTARRIDVNQLNMYLTNYGSFAWDVADPGQPPGLLYPKGTNKAAVYAAGLWLGAVVGGEVRTVVAEYSQEYGPGSMVDGTFDNPDNEDYRTYKVLRYSGKASDTAHVERPDPNDAAFEDPRAHDSWSEYMAGAVPYGAPWALWRLPNTDTADPSDSIDVPGPALVTGRNLMPDMLCWAVFNDADPANHSNDAGNSTPLGVEVQQTTFAFNRQGALGNVVFLRWIFINKGGNQLDSMFVSIWSDTDLGGAADDLVGCDILLSLGYTYNSTNNDQLYGSAPPAVGYDFFQGPLRRRFPGDDVELPMTSFNKYINGTDPASSSDTYNYMNGILPSGDPVIDPTTGEATKFFDPGDPTTRSGWLDSNPADRRHLLSSGPFYMAPGDTQVVVAALIIGNGNDRLSSVSAMKFYDEFAQLAFDEGFNLPSPPSQPDVSVEVDHGKVILSWDAKSRTDYHEPGDTFEGYNVYQGASRAGPWKRLATFDEANRILTVRDTVFDITTGRTIADFPMAFGTDAGVQFSYTIDQDGIRGGALHDGTEYYFAVTAYAVSPTEKLAVVENAQEVRAVTPQRPALGTDPLTASVGCPTYTQANPALPPTTDRVTVEVIDASAVTGHTYQVTFTPATPPYPVVNGDTVRVLWNILDATTGQTLARDLVNKAGDDDYVVVDGIRIRVIGPQADSLGLVEADFLCHPQRDLEGTQNLTPLLVPLAFGTGVTEAWHFFGGSLDPAASPDSFSTVEIRFDPDPAKHQRGYRYLRRERASDGLGGRVWGYGGFHELPFTVWDTDRGEQIDVMFTERLLTGDDGTILPPDEQVATFDSTWAPSDEGNGGREILVPLRSIYTASEKPELAVDAAILDDPTPMMYVVFTRRTSIHAPLPRSSTFRILHNSTLPTPNDTFVVVTAPLVRGNASLAKQGLGSIRVVPNPYYNRSRYELNQFARVMRFINMPEQATVRIFNLSGQLVRTLRKTDPTSSILNWDLLTENRLPVASGVYVYHVEAPGVGSTVGRLVVFMEKERLNDF